MIISHTYRTTICSRIIGFIQLLKIKIKEYKVTPKIAIVVKTIIIGHVFIQRKFYVLCVMEGTKFCLTTYYLFYVIIAI